MTRTATPSAARGPAAGGASDQRPADVLVIFGITGDLAKVMTFRSLYRLEPRGLLDCPIVGVAVDDWTVDQLSERAEARSSEPGSSSTRRSSTASPRASPTCRATSPTPRPTSAWPRRSAAPSSPVFYLEIPPFLFGTVVKGLAEAGLTKNARVVVEKPFGHDRASATRARRRAAPVHRRVAALPDRPLPRQDGARGDPLPALREHDARAGLEPQLHRVVQITMAERLRRRGSRPLLRPGRRAARRRRQPPHAGRRGGAMEAPAGGDPQTIKDAQIGAVPRDRRGRPRALRPRPVRRLPRHRRRRRRLDDRDVRRAPARHRQLALVGRAVLHSHRQAAAGHADRASARLQEARRGSASGSRITAPSRTSSW